MPALAENKGQFTLYWEKSTEKVIVDSFNYNETYHNALFSDSKQELWRWKAAVVQRLAALRLTVHKHSAQVDTVDAGIPWLGFIVYPTHRRLKARNVVKFDQRLPARWAEHCAGRVSFAEFDASVRGWVNYVRYADTWGLRQHVLGRPLPGKRPLPAKTTSSDRASRG